MKRELPSLIFNASGCFVRDEFAGCFEVVFRGGEVEGCLAAVVWMGGVVRLFFFFFESRREGGFVNEKEEGGEEKS